MPTDDTLRTSQVPHNEQGYPPPSTEPQTTPLLPQKAVSEPPFVAPDMKRYMTPQSGSSPSGTLVLPWQSTTGKEESTSAAESETPSEVDGIFWQPLQKGIWCTTLKLWVVHMF